MNEMQLGANKYGCESEINPRTSTVFDNDIDQRSIYDRNVTKQGQNINQ